MKRYIRSDIISTEDEDFNTKYYDIANNSSTRPSTLARLADDPDEYIRAMVARNSSTTSDVLSKLAHDPESQVRFATAQNPNTPVSDLMQLAGDPDEHVHSAVAGNPSTPVEVLEALSYEVGRIDDFLTRFWVASNKNTPLEVLQRLLADVKQPVRNAAEKTIFEVYGSETLRASRQ